MAGTLGPADTARLTDFARTLKAAARAVVLYPDGHPAVRSSLARLVDLTSSDRLRAPLRIGVTRDTLLIDGDAIQRPDGAVTELASMAKLKSGRLRREVSDACLQYWGGMGFTWDNPVSRAYRDGRLGSIGGGADEVMLGIICKYMHILPKK